MFMYFIFIFWQIHATFNCNCQGDYITGLYVFWLSGISELLWALGQGLLVDRRHNRLKVQNSFLNTSSRAGHWTRFRFQCTTRRRPSWRGIIPAASAQKLIQFCVLPHFFYFCGHARSPEWYCIGFDRVDLGFLRLEGRVHVRFDCAPASH